MPDKNQPKRGLGQEWGKSSPGNQPGGGQKSQSDQDRMFSEKHGQQQSGKPNKPQKTKPYDPDERGI